MCCVEDDNDNGREHLSHWQFCSELVANIYKDVGILPASVDAANVMPVDFITDPKNPTKTLDKDGEVPPLFDFPPVAYHS